MTLPANIRINVRVPFPTYVQGVAFIGVNKANGIWSIVPDYRLLAPSIGVAPTQMVALQDSITGVWSYIPASSLSSAPSSGSVTKRQWFEAVASLYNMNTLLSAVTANANNAAWIQFNAGAIVISGDPLSTLTQSVFGLSGAQLAALFTLAATLAP